MSPEETIGRYRIVERVGRGGMGVLYRGVDPVLDREVAIKVMSTDFAADADEEARGRFFREARAAAKLQHRNIVTIFEFADEGGVPYIVMEFLRGQSLSARIQTEPPLTLDEKLDIVTELCTGLQFAHENGVIHRDVKPGNVWLLEDGTVKLLDFGIAKVSSSTFTRQGDVLGSASYMSPEQIAGRVVDGRADVFSAAVVLYELLAGRKPFESDSPTSTILKIMQEEPPPLESIVADLPPALVAAVARGLQKDPADRYQTAGDFGAELQLIRMSRQSTGDTVFGDDLPLGETLYAPTRPETIVGDVAAQPMTRQGSSSFPASAFHRIDRRILMLSVTAAVLAIGGIGWLGATRLSSSKPIAAAAAPPPVTAVDGGGTPTHEAPPPVTPRNSVLHVVSEPDGASIDLDGRDTGLATPADLRIEGDAPKQMRLTKKGFQALDVRLSEAALAGGTITYRLSPAESATVKVTATGSYPFEVVEGQRVLSATATSHELTIPSAHVVRLRAPTYLLDYPFKVDASAGRTMRVSAPELGRLTIRSAMETCQVSVNRHDLGFPPITSQLIAAGTYSIQLKCPDGQTIRGSAVTVVAGQTIIAKVP